MITNHDYTDAPLFNIDATDKQFVITIKDKPDVITNDDVDDVGMVLEEILCSEPQLTFGSCEASQLTLHIAMQAVSFSLEGMTIYVKMYLNGHSNNLFNVGTYKVESDQKDASTEHRTIIAYDVLKDVLEADVSDWYDALLPNANSTTTIAAMRASFFSRFGLTQKSVTLINDDMTVRRTWTTPLSGRTVIFSICEANGVFGHINRDGEFVYLNILDNSNPLYPSDDLYPSDTLYPSDGTNRRISGADEDGGYTAGEFESFSVQKITQLEILAETGDIGQTIGADDSNIYTIDNALFFGMSAADLTTYGTRILNAIKDVTFVPYWLEVLGNPCYEVGDGVICQTYNGIIKSYILQRTLTGAQSLTDEYKANGEPTYTREVGFIRSMVELLETRGNILRRDVDETLSEIYDQNHVSRITQNANSISAEVTNRTNADYALGLRIDGVEGTFDLYVKFGEDYSGIKITKNKVHIKSTGTFQVDAGNFTIDQYGNVSMTGEVNATSGEIGGLSIGADGFYVSTSPILTVSSSVISLGYPVATIDMEGSTIDMSTNFAEIKMEIGDITIGTTNGDINLAGKNIKWYSASAAVANDYYVLCEDQGGQ